MMAKGTNHPLIMDEEAVWSTISPQTDIALNAHAGWAVVGRTS
jgi:hypothetical protein